MRKFLAVVKHEYKKIVLKWTFLVATLLFPLIAAAFAIVPALIFTIKGEATRIVLVDQSGKISERVRQNLSKGKAASDIKKHSGQPFDVNASQEEKIKNASSAAQTGENFVFIDYSSEGKSAEQIKRELNAKIIDKEIDAYLIVPPNYTAADADFEFFSRRAEDFIANSSLEDAVNSAVRSQRLADANINEAEVKNLSQNVELSVKKLSEKGDEKNGEGVFVAAFIVGLMIYLTLLIYGQQIMAAVIEEKETRIAEILFSSAKPFELMMGKLVGVGLAGFTQLAIWISSAVVLAVFGAANLSAAGMDISIPDITPLAVIYFFIFFLLGFFIYATIYALIGSMVTTVQEGGQFAMIPVGILMVGLYTGFAVIRDPNSNVSFWVSIAPFLAPLTMPVRILAETPPFWQIMIAVLVNLVTIAGLVWLAARIYRVGMLMYGKRATIPEVLKWLRQS